MLEQIDGLYGCELFRYSLNKLNIIIKSDGEGEKEQLLLEKIKSHPGIRVYFDLKYIGTCEGDKSIFIYYPERDLYESDYIKNIYKIVDLLNKDIQVTLEVKNSVFFTFLRLFVKEGKINPEGVYVYKLKNYFESQFMFLNKDSCLDNWPTDLLYMNSLCLNQLMGWNSENILEK